MPGSLEMLQGSLQGFRRTVTPRRPLCTAPCAPASAPSGRWPDGGAAVCLELAASAALHAARCLADLPLVAADLLILRALEDGVVGPDVSEELILAILEQFHVERCVRAPRLRY